MRAKFIPVLTITLLLADLCAVGVVVFVFRNSVWHLHLLRFFHSAWVNFLELEGSSVNGFVSGILVAVLTILGVLFIVGQLNGLAAMKDHWLQNAGIGLFVLLVLTVLVYGSQFAWEVTKTGYDDHHSLVLQNGDLIKENAIMSEKNSRLIDELKAQNPYEKSYIGSYAYTNTVGAFSYIARDPSHQPNEHSECQVKITTPPENRSVAYSIRSIASAMGCYVLQEPSNPDSDAESFKAINSSLNNFVVIHAEKDNSRADGFVVGMSNTFHVQRAYTLPPESPTNLVWLQFGTGSVWRIDK